MSVATKEELLNLLRSHSARLKTFGVTRLSLFGSFVRNEPTPQSDVDLLVELEPGRETLVNYMNLIFFIEELSGRRVDLLTPQWLSPHIGPHILKEAENVALNP